MHKLALGLSLAFALIGTVRLVNSSVGVQLAKQGADGAKTDLAKFPDSDAKTNLGKDGTAKTDLGGRL